MIIFKKVMNATSAFVEQWIAPSIQRILRTIIAHTLLLPETG
jgi:hypothetical protein